MRPISLQNKKLETIISILGIILSAFIFAISVNTFISPTGMLTGGVSGISLIVGRLISGLIKENKETTFASIFYFIFNFPVLVLGWKKLNKRFTIFSLIHITCTSIFLNVFPDGIGNILEIDFTTHRLEASLFAGALGGFSTALSFLSHGSGGGIDIISAYFSTVRQKSIGSFNMLINGTILIVGGLLFKNWGAMLYSVVYTILNTMVLDMIYVRNKKTILNIITNNGDAVAQYIMDEFKRGVTKLNGIGAYTGAHKDFLYVVTTSYEAREICEKVLKYDPGCFISMTVTQHIYGRFVRTTQKY